MTSLTDPQFLNRDDVQDDDDIILPPLGLDSDEPPLESDLHLFQIMLLLQCLNSHWQDRQDFYATGI